MGDYTRVGLVRSGSGYSARLTPSGTVNFCITRAEETAKKYLGITPDAGTAYMEDACTSLAIHYLSLRLATQNLDNIVYQGQYEAD